MDERAPKPPLTDDPSFSKSLADLDRGLLDDQGSTAKDVRRPAPKPFRPPPSSAGLPLHLTPQASAALAAASEALAAFGAPPAETPTGASAAPSGSRTLPDLIPVAQPASRPAVLTGPIPAPAHAPPVRRSVAPPTHRSAPSYERFYGLAESPFSLSPDPRFIFHSSSYDRILQDLAAAAGRHESAILVTGQFGVGKTTLCRSLVDRLGRRTLVSFVTEPFVALEDLLETMLVDFGVISRADAVSGHLSDASRDDLAATLRAFLGSLASLHAAALLVIDDAGKLTSAALNELHILFEMPDGQTLLQVVLAGEPELATRLRSADLRKLDGRIGFRAEVSPLASEDVARYVAHRLAVAGTGTASFDAGALARVFALSHGTPRTVNLICDRALVMGQRASARVIDGALVDRAARDLALLPEAGASSSPWRGRLLMIALLLALMFAGAAGAGWMFRGPLERVLTRWHVLR